MSDQMTCRKVSCCRSDGVEFSPFTYSLVNGGTYTNEEFTITIPCPEGYDCTAPEVTIIIPPGTVQFTPTVLNPNPPKGGNPWHPAGGTYVFECGTERLTVVTTGGAFTAQQITDITNFLAACQAQQDSTPILQPVPVLTPAGDPGIRLWNTEQTCTAECPPDETGDPVTVTIPARTYSSIVAQSATPLAKYLAQQELDSNTHDAACAQAEAALVCVGVPCPIIATGIPAVAVGCTQCTFDGNNNWVFVTDRVNQTVVKIDPTTDTVIGTSASFGDNTAGIVAVSGPTTVSLDPALIVTTESGNLYHVDPVTLAITLLGVLTGPFLTPIVYAQAAVPPKVFIPIGQPVGGMYVYEVSTGTLTVINGTTVPVALAYDPTLNEVFATNFDAVLYPGKNLLALDANSLAVTKQLAFSSGVDLQGTNSICYVADTAKLYCGTHNSGTGENKVYVVDGATFTEDTTLPLASSTINAAPMLNYASWMQVVLASVRENTLATDFITVINPLNLQEICDLTGVRIDNIGISDPNAISFYAHVRSATIDLQIAKFAFPP